MEKYIAVLGRQPLISIAELESLYPNVRRIATNLAELESEQVPEIRRLGGTLKIAQKIEQPLTEFWKTLPADGKITIGVSDFTPKTTAFFAQREALRIKRHLVKTGRSVRVVANKTAVLSNATSLHNHLLAKNKIELLKYKNSFFRVVGISDIEAYARRDQKRPARDAKVGMLPPKLAQILVNLCGELPKGARILDPFCGTGVLLQEAMMMGYTPYGTDINERMTDYTLKNLQWIIEQERMSASQKISEMVKQGDATSFQWDQPIDAVACETYLGPPLSNPPAEIRLREIKQECEAIIWKFLENLSGQIVTGTPVVIAVPAWLRPNGQYERLGLVERLKSKNKISSKEVDSSKSLRYNVCSFKNLEQSDLLYHRDGQIVAREIIVLRKK